MTTKKRKSPVRAIIPQKPVGLDPAKCAPYWQGERAEHIVALRTKLYTKERELAAHRRAGKGTPQGQKGRNGAPRAPKRAL
jgi:hypothetical protein